MILKYNISKKKDEIGWKTKQFGRGSLRKASPTPAQRRLLLADSSPRCALLGTYSSKTVFSLIDSVTYVYHSISLHFGNKTRSESPSLDLGTSLSLSLRPWIAWKLPDAFTIFRRPPFLCLYIHMYIDQRTVWQKVC